MRTTSFFLLLQAILLGHIGDAGARKPSTEDICPKPEHSVRRDVERKIEAEVSAHARALMEAGASSTATDTRAFDTVLLKQDAAEREVMMYRLCLARAGGLLSQEFYEREVSRLNALLGQASGPSASADEPSAQIIGTWNVVARVTHRVCGGVLGEEIRYVWRISKSESNVFTIDAKQLDGTTSYPRMTGNFDGRALVVSANPSEPGKRTSTLVHDGGSAGRSVLLRRTVKVEVALQADGTLQGTRLVAFERGPKDEGYADSYDLCADHFEVSATKVREP